MRNRFTGIDFWDGVIFGALIGFILAMLVSWSFAESSEPFWKYITQLATIVATLFAAVIALSGPRNMITSANERAKIERKAEQEASRAVLPLVLSNIVEIARYGYGLTYITRDQLRDQKSREDVDTEKLTIHKTNIDIIKENIRFSDQSSREWLSALIAHYQVCLVNTEERLSDRSVSLSNTRDLQTAARWLVLNAIAHHLLEYARGEQGVPANMDGAKISAPFDWEPDGFLDNKLKNHLVDLRDFYSPFHFSNFKLTQKQINQNSVKNSNTQSFPF